ncbi:signal peptidase I [Streptacidiphilus sp. P02-A3a]|uniref:signal peptidase I n=1 Tax=Streptacidiphilus sp. P02-A3a TaxID=2704468 RepID=UPI0015F88865|nr:signal peptidase I [Streptacidiphilus sp. P02-A3a]QMU72326.1 signal peptidase I [Streptacidiphilus sp. P02-A3a]
MAATATRSGRDERHPGGRKPGRRDWSAGAILQGVGITVGLIAMVAGFVLLAVQYRPYSVPTDSMAPTVAPGDTVLAHPVKPADIGRGDVVIFNDPLWEGSDLVKRVVAIGGDTVACCDSSGRITVNGHPITEPYLEKSGSGPQLGQDRFSVRVPQGRLFLLGDNRAVSQDSRVHLTLDDGTVAANQVVARVEGVAWPLGDARTIARTSAFDALPGQDATAHLPLAAEVWSVLGGAALVLFTAALGTFGGLVRRLRGRRG